MKFSREDEGKFISCVITYTFLSLSFHLYLFYTPKFRNFSVSCVSVSAVLTQHNHKHYVECLLSQTGKLPRSQSKCLVALLLQQHRATYQEKLLSFSWRKRKGKTRLRALLHNMRKKGEKQLLYFVLTSSIFQKKSNNLTDASLLSFSLPLACGNVVIMDGVGTWKQKLSFPSSSSTTTTNHHHLHHIAYYELS